MGATRLVGRQNGGERIARPHPTGGPRAFVTGGHDGIRNAHRSDL